MATGGARVHIYGDWDGTGVKRAQQDLGVFQRQAAGFSGAFTKSMMGAGAALGGAFAIGAVVGNTVDFLKDAAGAAIEDEKSVVALEKALQNLGLAHKSAGVEDFIGKLTMATGVADDELRPAYQKLVTATGDVTKSQKLLQLAMDISAGTGKDLASVSQALSKASLGNVAALTRMGVPLDANIIKNKDFAAVVDSLSKKFDGQAAAAADTYGGKLKRLQTAADEAKEAIGYQLMKALDGVSESMGGVGGAQDVITGFGEATSNLVYGVGKVVEAIGRMTAELKNSKDEGTNFGDIFQTTAGILGVFIPGMAEATNAVVGFIDASERGRKAEEAAQRPLDAVTARYQGLAAAYYRAQGAASLNTDATNDATDATQKLATANDLLKSSLDRIANRDDVIAAIRAIGKAAKDAKGDLDGNSKASMDLRAALGAAANASLLWAQSTGTSAQDVYDKFTGRLAAMRQKLIDTGVNAKDVDRWLNRATWDTQFKLLADSIGKGPAAEAMRYAGMAAGRNAWKGIVAGLREGQDDVTTAAVNLASAANRGAQTALDAHSPSRVFIGLGHDAADGLAIGLKEGESKAAKAGMGIVQAALNAAKQMVADAKSNAGSALGAMQGLSDSIVGQVLGNVGFGSLTKQIKDELGNTTEVALTPQELMQTLFGSIAQQGNAVQAVAQNIGDKLPPELLNMVMSLPPDTAVALADYLGANPDQLERLAYNYDTLGHMTENLLGAPMGEAWAKVGNQSAKEMLAAARELIKDRKDSFTAWVANQLGVSIPVAVTFTGGSVPARAMGGPVSAGGTYLVGERGPELFTPSSAGSITPNSRLGGGNTYTINVTAPASVDRRRMGQELVEMIREFENSSGAVWSAA